MIFVGWVLSSFSEVRLLWYAHPLLSVFKVRWIGSFILKYKWNLEDVSTDISILLKFSIQKYKFIMQIEGHIKKSLGHKLHLNLKFNRTLMLISIWLTFDNSHQTCIICLNIILYNRIKYFWGLISESHLMNSRSHFYLFHYTILMIWISVFKYRSQFVLVK